MQGSTLKIFGVLFVILGIALFLYSLLVGERIKRSRTVEARIVDMDVTVRHKHGRREKHYAPVYEYCEDGEYKRYKSILYSLTPPEIGKETILYISEDGAVTEGSVLLGARIGGILLLFFGIFFVKLGSL